MTPPSSQPDSAAQETDASSPKKTASRRRKGAAAKATTRRSRGNVALAEKVEDAKAKSEAVEAPVRKRVLLRKAAKSAKANGEDPSAARAAKAAELRAARSAAETVSAPVALSLPEEPLATVEIQSTTTPPEPLPSASYQGVQSSTEVGMDMKPQDKGAGHVAAETQSDPTPERAAEPDEGTSDRRGRKRGRGAKLVDAAHYVVAPPVASATMQSRHYAVIVLFALMVLLPVASYSWYLWTRAVDQFESDVGFGSRTEEGPSTFDFLGALSGGSQAGSKDMDILNQFVVSQELVAKIDAELDLRALWSKPEGDPLYALQNQGTIEDLVHYWQRMVLVDYDNATGLMNLRVFAFDPADAQRIANSILRESTAIINKLSQTAQDDTTRYSKDMLAETETKLAAARLAVLDYQVKNNIVDPSNVVSNQLSVVASLNQELANTQVDLDLLTGTVPASDPRIATLKRKLEVIEARIEAEKAKVGATANPGQPGYAELVADFERLKVDLDFAQNAYLSALAAHDQALADAQKKTRYLATYVAPTLAEAPTAPVRLVNAALMALAGFLLWSITVLTYYALRDRR